LKRDRARRSDGAARRPYHAGHPFHSEYSQRM
jgi:hypothetical protein